MVLAILEKIMKDPNKMAYYEKDPILKATFLAVYDYLKAGYKLKELGWFISKVDQEHLKKAT